MRFSLVPQERRFYDLFAKQGALVHDTLVELSKSLFEGRSRHPRLRDLEHEADDVAHEIYRLVNQTFVTPIEREDILALASALDDIVDLAEEVSDKIDLYHVKEISEAARRMGENLAKAGDILARALEDLEGFRELEPRRIEIHRLENETDLLTREALAALFTEERTAADLVKWKDIYDLLEGTMDGCETVANVLETMAIKNA
jgi:predicted phosphate transport protein (TIGR00153 family)